ncbi:MAG: hypothetical protein LC790_22740 [Actinobacteria bacterium]|nr:hypothetical protein [Actinomycetota bacterium]
MQVRTVVAAGIALVMAVGLSACKKGLEEKTLTFTEKESNNFGFLDNPPKAKLGKEGPDKLTDGDVISFSSDMVDASGKDVGDLDATCITTRKGRFDQASASCQGTFTLPKGQLFATVGGKAFGSETTTGAIIGGTGDYEGATGSFTSKGEQNSKDSFKLFLPK